MRRLASASLLILMLAVTPLSSGQQPDPKEVTDFQLWLTSTTPENLRGIERAQQISISSGLALSFVRSNSDGSRVVIRHASALTRAEAWELAERVRATSGAIKVQPIDPNFRKSRPPGKPPGVR